MGQPSTEFSAPASAVAASQPIWLIDDGLIMGGGQAFALRLCRWLLTAQPTRELRLLCAEDSALAHRARAAGVTVMDAAFPAPNVRNALPAIRAAASLRRLLARSPVDALVIANSARVQAYVVALWPTLRGGRRLVNVMHERESARRASARFALRHVGGVAAVGDSGLATYREALGGVSVAKVSNFLLPEEFEAMAERRRSGPGATAPVVGVLSRMCAGKGIPELVDELASQPQGWARLLVGAAFQDADYVEAVRERCRVHGLADRVELLGEVASVEDFLATVDILVVPSVAREGQPTVILEGLACGRPVLVRSHIWTADYEGLPVAAYDGAEELARLLRGARWAPASAADLIARFDPIVVVQTLLEIAR
jgi:glycosyltransferase involved in cell wall biosynthesis